MGCRSEVPYDEYRNLLGAPVLGHRAGVEGGYFDVRGVQILVAVNALPDEIYAAPRSWAERAYPELIRYNKLDKGGHFAAWEQPELFATEIRAAFRSLRWLGCRSLRTTKWNDKAAGFI